MLNLFSETSWPLLEIRFVANKPWCTLKEYHLLPRILTFFWKGSIVLKPRWYLENAYRKPVDFREGLLNVKGKKPLWFGSIVSPCLIFIALNSESCVVESITCRHQKETRNSWIKKCINSPLTNWIYTEIITEDLMQKQPLIILFPVNLSSSLFLSFSPPPQLKKMC